MNTLNFDLQPITGPESVNLYHVGGGSDRYVIYRGTYKPVPWNRWNWVRSYYDGHIGAYESAVADLNTLKGLLANAKPEDYERIVEDFKNG